MLSKLSLFPLLLTFFLAQPLTASSKAAAVDTHQFLQNAECLCSQEEVEKAIDHLANQMNASLKDKYPLVLCVLKGAIVTTGMLLPKLHFPLELDYIHASRYKKDNGGKLEWYAKPQKSLEGRCVVLVDDICDKGITLASLKKYCLEQGASEVYSAVLIDKNTTREAEGFIGADFNGLTIPDKFIVGSGLDYEGYYRNIPGIHIMPEAYR